MTTLVQDHYGASGIVGRILAAVPWSSGDTSTLTADRLFPYDQLHGREILATRDHAARLNPANEAHVLDIGSGIGGPARYFASTFGCRVTGIDLTPDFVNAATELTRLSALSGQVAFVEGDAAAMPFEADTFDHACCFYVGMNLADKPSVLAESFRVLKEGATLIWTEVTTEGGAPHYPLPWARAQEGSHLVSRDRLTDRISEAGFQVLSVEDETDAHLELARRAMAEGTKPSRKSLQVNELVLGDDFMERRKNYIRSLSEGAIASTVILARK